MDIPETLRKKLPKLPLNPGVYFHKSATGEVIYVGKAAVLKNRVRQYFQASRGRDVKTEALVAEIADTDWIVVDSELDALFLESEMVKRYKPRYNVLLRDDKSQIYVRIPMDQAYPPVTYTRYPLDDNAEYFGPYYNARAIRRALRYLRKTFPYSVHETMPKRPCLQYHLGLCPGVEAQKISSADYKDTLRKLIRYLRGERTQLVREIERDMKQAAADKRFEDAAKLRNRLYNLKALQNQIVFRDEEFMDLSKDMGLSGLMQLLNLPSTPKRIEGYDISHMQGTNNVASMVVATNGIAHKGEYRKFKMQLPGNDDFGHMRETMLRRFSGRHTEWPMPDLILIDGGKGQLAAAATAAREKGVLTPMIGLAKRTEQIVIHRTLSNIELNVAATQPYKDEKNPLDRTMVVNEMDFILVNLPHSSHIVKLLQRIRDESHRFAVSYHTVLKRQGQIHSTLDSIPGVGPTTRKNLIHTFGSALGVKAASMEQLSATLGPKKGAMVYNWLHGKASLNPSDSVTDS